MQIEYNGCCMVFLSSQKRKGVIVKQQTSKDLLSYVREFLSSTEDLIGVASQEGGEKVRQLHQQAKENLKVAKAQLVKAEKYLANKASDTAHATDEFVHEYPWQAVGIASLVGLLLGLLISRR